MTTGTFEKGIVIGSPALQKGTLTAAYSNGIGVTVAPAEIADDHIVTRAQGKQEDSRVLQGM
jgi:hypothetical protein